VLRKACLEAATWPDNLSVAVNLSPAQLRSRTFVFSVAAALEVSHLAATRLELEITETVLLQNTEAVLQALHQIRDLGVRIAMDDFGTGYSSLSYLRSFPFDKIKIDRSFVGGLDAVGDSVAIIRAVTGLAGSLGMTTTAEGVETEEQLDILRTEGCTQVQGYLFSRPQPAKDIPALLQALAGRESSATSAQDLSGLCLNEEKGEAKKVPLIGRR
jgi:EAL domain-containing protein (putative c-di-GMP-specific phosphodiesterase class I)